MSSGDELGVVEEWLASTLGNDLVLAQAIEAAGNPDGSAAIYHSEAPDEAGYPFVVFQHQGGPFGGAADLGAGADINTVGPGRVMVQSNWVVKAVRDGSSPLPLRPIVNRVDQLLVDKTATIASGVVVACKRLGPISYPQVDDKRLFRHRGGLYRMWSTATA